jgi:hypothetical protein
VQPFSTCDTAQIINKQKQALLEKINDYSNDQIMANNLELLAVNCYEEFKIFPVDIQAELLTKRTVKQSQIRKPIYPFSGGFDCADSVIVAGVVVAFYFPFTGDPRLFTCRASTFSVSGYPEISIDDRLLSFTYKIPLTQLRSPQDMEGFMKQLDCDLSAIKRGISYANNDVSQFNETLKDEAIK